MKFLKESPAIRSMARLPAHATVACALAGTPLLSLADTPAGDTVLAPVKVTGQRTDNPDYGSSLTSVGKMPMAQRDIPQSTTVITRQLMDDQQDTTLREALRNVSGLTINAGEGGASGDSFTLRGYSVATDLFLDGVRDAGHIGLESFLVLAPDWLRNKLELLIHVFMIIFGVFMGYYGITLGIGQWDELLPTLGIPDAFRYFPIGLCGILMTLFSIEHIIAQLTDKEVEPAWH